MLRLPFLPSALRSCMIYLHKWFLAVVHRKSYDLDFNLYKMDTGTVTESAKAIV